MNMDQEMDQNMDQDVNQNDEMIDDNLDHSNVSSFSLSTTKTSKLMELPNEILQNIVSLLTQSDLINLTLTSKLFYKLSTRTLYSKLYLNDSVIEYSDVYQLASSWSWLKLKPNPSSESSRKEANYKLKCLLETLMNNPNLVNNILEVRLNWDLDIQLQKKFVFFITNSSKSLQIIENVTDPELNEAIINTNNYTSTSNNNGDETNNLISLDLPPPNPLPSLEISDDYLPNAKKYMIKRLSHDNIKVLTLFIDPLLLFNNLIKLPQKNPLEIESIKLHCRADTYPTILYNRRNWEFNKLSEIFNTSYLKVLTIISWYDHICPDRIYKFDQWSEFPNLEDITLIAVTYNDKKISNLIENCRILKRLKLDFSYPKREMSKNSLVYKSIFKHKFNLKFLDIKLNLTNRIFNLDIREFSIVLKIPCNCYLCQEIVFKEIFQKKILPKREDYKIENIDQFEQINFFEQLFESSLSPYSKAVDKYPSVKTGPDTIKDFLNRYNQINLERSKNFNPLNEQDFYNLYHCLIHSIKIDIEPFLIYFKKLKFLVINDISLIIFKDDLTGTRYPVPIFYSDGFKTNFDTKNTSNSSSDYNSNQFDGSYGRSLYLN